MLQEQRHPQYIQRVHVPGTAPVAWAGAWLSVLGRLRGAGTFDLAQTPHRPGLHLIQSGAGWLSVEGGPEQALAPGDAFLIAPGEFSRYREDPRRPWRYTWLGFDGPQAMALLGAAGFSPGIRVRRAAATPALWQICDEAEAAFAASSCSPFLAPVLALRIAEAFAPGIPAVPTDPAAALRLVMDSGYVGEMTVGGAAQHLGMDRSTLFRRFRAAYGSGPRAYLKAGRLERARELLRRGGMTVTAVAAACGYADHRAFARAFKARFGMNPGTLR